MSHEYYNIVIGGEGVRRRSNGINAEKITFFNNFVRVSKGLLSTIVGLSTSCSYNRIYHMYTLQQGRQNIFLSEGSGNEWQAPIGRGSWGQGQSTLKFFTSTPLDCKKAPLLVSKYTLPPAPMYLNSDG